MNRSNPRPANDTTAEHATLPAGAPPLRVRIPRLVDVLLVSEPEQIRWLNHQPQVVRSLDPSASLLHRILERRMNVDLAFESGFLPVFQHRHDNERASRQRALQVQLERVRGLPGDEQAELAAYVSGEQGASPIGVSVQQWCGQLFHSHYRASPESYAAGGLIAKWPSAPPWRTWAARASGELARAKQLLYRLAEEDVHCVHATSIGMSNVTRTIERLRAAARDPSMQRLSPDDVLRETLVAPPAVLRGCSGRLEAPFVARPLSERTLIVFLVAKSFARSKDLDDAFLADQWSGCPAHEAVPEMLRAVWHAAHHAEAEHERLFATIHGFRRFWQRAVS